MVCQVHRVFRPVEINHEELFRHAFQNCTRILSQVPVRRANGLPVHVAGDPCEPNEFLRPSKASCRMPRSELSTVEVLQKKKAASVSGGLKSFVFVASPEITLQNNQSDRAGNDAGMFFFSCRGFCRSFIFSKLTESVASALCSA